MTSIRQKGKLDKWLDDKGFGFITPEKGTKTVFVHISAFDHNISRRPISGDTVFYHISIGQDGKEKAVDAILEGVKIQRKSPPLSSISSPNRHRQRTSSAGLIISLILLIIAGGAIYKLIYSNDQSLIVPATQTQPDQSTGNFSCDGRTHCSQMNSCEEATYFIRNCPGTKMDGNGDGVPCEKQWCY